MPRSVPVMAAAAHIPADSLSEEHSAPNRPVGHRRLSDTEEDLSDPDDQNDVGDGPDAVVAGRGCDCGRQQSAADHTNRPQNHEWARTGMCPRAALQSALLAGLPLQELSRVLMEDHDPPFDRRRNRRRCIWASSVSHSRLPLVGCSGADCVLNSYSADEAVGITLNHLMFRKGITRKQLGEALGITGPAAGRKLRGENHLVAGRPLRCSGLLQHERCGPVAEES